ncbi:MAG: DUF2460 domain-containing protein [Pseudomonadota bacterium]
MASSFHDIRFPIDIGFGSSAGPERNTEIITLGSGFEKRNQRWSQSRRRYDAGYGVKDLDTLHEVIAFFEARRGALHAFRFRDPLDWKSCAPLQNVSAIDQSIGTGDGQTQRFSLVKTYGAGESAYQRTIAKPVVGTLKVAVDGVAQTLGQQFAMDANSHDILFTPNNVPPEGALITAGYEFDVPVRFDTDQLTVNLAAFAAGDVPSIPLVEVLL